MNPGTSICFRTTCIDNSNKPRRSLSSWPRCRRADRDTVCARAPNRPDPCGQNSCRETISRRWGSARTRGGCLRRATIKREPLRCVVISYRAWETDFARDPAIVGSTVYVQTHPFIVAGIAPPGFFGDRIIAIPPDFWMPLGTEPVIEGANSAVKQT